MRRSTEQGNSAEVLARKPRLRSLCAGCVGPMFRSVPVCSATFRNVPVFAAHRHSFKTNPTPYTPAPIDRISTTQHHVFTSVTSVQFSSKIVESLWTSPLGGGYIQPNLNQT